MMIKTSAIPFFFALFYVIPAFGISWILTFLIRRRHPRWPRALLWTFFAVICLLLAPIPDQGDIELLGWKLWKSFGSSSSAE